MEFGQLVRERQSCRNFDPRPVPTELVGEIVRTALLAPSACNSQPWKVYLADTPAAADRIRPLAMGRSGNGNPFCKNVAAFAVVTETKAKLFPGAERVFGSTQYFAQTDIGIFVAHLVLAARDKGVASCILGAFDDAGLRAALSVPAEETVRLVVALGYAASDDSVRPKTRKPLSDMLVRLT